MHPSSLRAFQRDQEHHLKHPGLVDLISTNKTNKQPSFTDRLVWPVPLAQSMNPLQNRETQHVNIVLQCMY
jgi:hypothetical protein